MERLGLNKVSNRLNIGGNVRFKRCDRKANRKQKSRVQFTPTRGSPKTMDNAFCTCNIVFGECILLIYFSLQSCCHVVYENFLMFELNGIDLFLIKEEMTKYVTCKFIQYQVDDLYFHNSNIHKSFIRSLWSRFNGIQKLYMHQNYHTNTYIPCIVYIWIPRTITKCRLISGFPYKLFIPLYIQQTIRMRSDVHLQQFLFGLSVKFWSQNFFLQYKSSKATETQKPKKL